MGLTTLFGFFLRNTLSEVEKYPRKLCYKKKKNKITAAPMCNFSSCYMELQNQYLELIIAILFIVFLCTT